MLVDLSYVQGPVHGPLVASQLIDVTVRAEGVRDYAVKCMLGLLLDANLFMGQSQTTISNVLYAAGWIIGEYADHLPLQSKEVRIRPLARVIWYWWKERWSNSLSLLFSSNCRAMVRC